mgnify:CR=1 FL=1
MGASEAGLLLGIASGALCVLALALAVVAADLRAALPGCRLGVNVLRNDVDAALAVRERYYEHELTRKQQKIKLGRSLREKPCRNRGGRRHGRRDGIQVEDSDESRSERCDEDVDEGLPEGR